MSNFSISLFLVTGLMLATGCTGSKPSVSDITLCAHPEGPVCMADAHPDPRSPVFHITATLHNIPRGDSLSVEWSYENNGNSTRVDSVEIDLPEGGSVVSSSITMPAKGWPKGNYKVILNSQRSGISEEIRFSL